MGGQDTGLASLHGRRFLAGSVVCGAGFSPGREGWPSRTVCRAPGGAPASASPSFGIAHIVKADPARWRSALQSLVARPFRTRKTDRAAQTGRDAGGMDGGMPSPASPGAARAGFVRMGGVDAIRHPEDQREIPAVRPVAVRLGAVRRGPCCLGPGRPGRRPRGHAALRVLLRPAHPRQIHSAERRLGQGRRSRWAST